MSTLTLRMTHRQHSRIAAAGCAPDEFAAAAIQTAIDGHKDQLAAKITVTLRPGDRAWLETIAAEQDISMAEAARAAVEQALDRAET